jgi:methyl-accepting chemotaxis protein
MPELKQLLNISPNSRQRLKEAEELARQAREAQLKGCSAYAEELRQQMERIYDELESSVAAGSFFARPDSYSTDQSRQSDK